MYQHLCLFLLVLLVEAMKRDKKHQGDQIIFVLLKGIGTTVITGDVQAKLLAEAWEQTLEERTVE